MCVFFFSRRRPNFFFSFFFFCKTRAVGACVRSPFCARLVRRRLSSSSSREDDLVGGRFVFSLRLARAENFFVFVFFSIVCLL